MPRRHTLPAKTTKVGWTNRIIRHGSEPASQLLANEANWKIHARPQQNAMRAILGNEIGWIQSAIVNLRTDPEWGANQGVQTMIDGHMRVQLALTHGEETLVPITYVDLTPREERLALASFDRVGALYGTDDQQYDTLLASLTGVTEDLASVLVRSEKKPKAKGLTHKVQPCTCCGKQCNPNCGCYREED